MELGVFLPVGVWSLVLLGFLTSCTRSNSPTSSHPLPASALVSACEPGQPGGRLTLVGPGTPRTFNPLFATDAASDGIVRLLFGSLINLNMITQEAGPGLAESWTVEPDGKTWTFKLRQGVRWSDGAFLTAGDVVFTWNKIMYNPQLNSASYDLFRIGGTNFSVTNPDNFTVRVVTPEVFAPFLEFFGPVPVLPRHTLEPAIQAHRFPLAYAPETPPERIVGCGPYRLKEFRPGKFTLLVRNSEYWVTDRQHQRLPYFDEVLINAGAGPGADTALFLNDQSDVCETLRPEDYAQLQQASTNGHFRLLELGPGTERDFLWFNQNTGTNPAGKPLVEPAKLKWFRNKKFRQAISCAIDRDRIAREAYGGRAQAISTFISAENRKWYNPDVPRYGFDLTKAKALLAEVGLQDRHGTRVLEDESGNRAEILFNSNLGNPLRAKAAALIQEDLSKIGIKLLHAPLDFRVLETKVSRTYDYECALMGLAGGSIDPASQVNVLRSSEDLHQWFPLQKTPATDWEARIDWLMDAQMRTLDFPRRKRYFDEVQTILAEQQPMICTVSPLASAALRLNLTNLRPTVLTPYHLTWNLEELFVGRAQTSAH